MKKIIALLIFTTVTFSGFSQEESEQEKSNIQEYTPSKLLKKGQWDIKFFNGLYTQTERTDSGSESVTIPRENFYTNTTELYTGISENSRINIGLIFQIRSNTVGGAGALDVFKFENNGINAKSGLTTIAPSIRIQPFENAGNFSITSSLFIPIFKDRPNTIYLDERSITWETKFFYDKTFGNDKWQVFTEVDFGFNFGEKAIDENEIDITTIYFNNIELYANNSLFMPLSAFLSYFPSPKTTVFVNTKQAFLIDLGNNFSQNSTSLGLGGKYQLTNVLNIEASFDKFVRGASFQGLGQTFSLGLRAIF
ncbi:MAG: hypothetical protein L3J09_00910 [Flavobacteriaceae bacterium]|nr:hypothetical protein [Flavobacteriaceae bacterium]